MPLTNAMTKTSRETSENGYAKKALNVTQLHSYEFTLWTVRLPGREPRSARFNQSNKPRRPRPPIRPNAPQTFV
jgi:hypothetical protein